MSEIRKCDKEDFESIYEIVNDASKAYKGVIPKDRWKEPYMSKEELAHEIKEGVVFYGYEINGELIGVMGFQDVVDVTLIRQAYVRTMQRKKGIGGQLLNHLKKLIKKSILVGTWADASWAINFYIKNGFELVSEDEKNILLRKYWAIPQRQVETSVVLKERNS